MNDSIEDAVRAELAARAQAVAPGPAPYEPLRRRITRRRRTRTALAAGAAAVALTAGVGVAAGHTDHGSTAAPAARASVVPGGCGATPVQRGAAPAWTATAHVPADLPYVVTAEGNAVGFLFSDRLRSGTPKSPQNKILWVVDTPDDHYPGPLTITATSPAAIVANQYTTPGIGGGSYPAVVDVPTTGCWHFTLRWTGGTGNVDLSYGS